jgi:hypothetical protein
MNLSARLALLAAGLHAGADTQADCKPLLDALNRTAQQSRFGVYEVQSPEQALGAEADVVIVGTVSYVRSGKDWERIEIGELGGHWAELRKEVAVGDVHCKTEGTGRYRGAVVTKLTVTRSKAQEPSRVFIDQRSGLPVYEGTSDGGVAVVYGDAVKEPKLQK